MNKKGGNNNYVPGNMLIDFKFGKLCTSLVIDITMRTPFFRIFGNCPIRNIKLAFFMCQRIMNGIIFSSNECFVHQFNVINSKS